MPKNPELPTPSSNLNSSDALSSHPSSMVPGFIEYASKKTFEEASNIFTSICSADLAALQASRLYQSGNQAYHQMLGGFGIDCKAGTNSKDADDKTLRAAVLGDQGLGSVTFDEREAASTLLTKAGPAGIEVLLDTGALDNSDPEIRDRARKIVENRQHLYTDRLPYAQSVESFRDPHEKQLPAFEQLASFLEIDKTQASAGVKEIGNLLKILNPEGKDVSAKDQAAIAGLKQAQKDLENIDQIKKSVREIGSEITFLSGADPAEITDQTTARIASAAPNLNSLLLGDSQVTDNGMESIGHLAKLQMLQISGNQITDKGLNQIKGLKDLTELSLTHTMISDAGLKDLSGMEKLVVLDLSNTQVTDQGMGELVKCKNLKVLTLCNDRITDGAVEQLSKMQNLKILDLSGTNVSKEAVEALKKAIPHTVIISGDHIKLPPERNDIG